MELVREKFEGVVDDQIVEGLDPCISESSVHSPLPFSASTFDISSFLRYSLFLVSMVPIHLMFFYLSVCLIWHFELLTS